MLCFLPYIQQQQFISSIVGMNQVKKCHNSTHVSQLVTIHQQASLTNYASDPFIYAANTITLCLPMIDGFPHRFPWNGVISTQYFQHKLYVYCPFLKLTLYVLFPVTHFCHFILRQTSSFPSFPHLQATQKSNMLVHRILIY